MTEIDPVTPVEHMIPVTRCPGSRAEMLRRPPQQTSNNNKATYIDNNKQVIQQHLKQKYGSQVYTTVHVLK